jgi:hypothetical protein
MPYIKVENNKVILGGALLHSTDEGWFFYDGEVYENSIWDDVKKIVIQGLPNRDSVAVLVDEFIEKAAIVAGYKSSLELISYATDTINFSKAVLAARFVSFRSQVWEMFEELYRLGEEGSEIFDVPSLIALLPTFDPVVTKQQEVIAKCNHLLQATDFYQCQDILASLSAEKSEAVSAYRQQLRSIKNQEDFTNVKWPVLS